MPEDPNHTPHHHIEHIHEDGADHRDEVDCPGDEEATVAARDGEPDEEPDPSYSGGGGGKKPPQPGGG